MPPTFRFRRLHRLLGVIVGVQLVLWIAGGLFFAWTDLDEIHGDRTRAEIPPPPFDPQWRSPAAILAAENPAALVSAAPRAVDGRPLWLLVWTDAGGDVRRGLFDALTGAPRPPLSRDEAVRLAQAGFAPEAAVTRVDSLTPGDVGPHHEYRGGPLPAWRVEFDHPSGTRVYVAAAEARVATHRNAKWRVFDFLWMLHTMDFRGRDDINNPVLRAGSLLAAAVAVSGYLLWWRTRRRRR